MCDHRAVGCGISHIYELRAVSFRRHVQPKKYVFDDDMIRQINSEYAQSA